MRTDLSDHTAVVTGAAAGIGRATASLFSDHGATVVGLDIDAEPHDSGPRFGDVVERGELVVGDVSDPERVDELFAVAREYAEPSIAVNNAGIGSRGSISDVGLDAWREMYRVHVEGAYQVCRRALPAMVERGDGRIVNVSSVGALVPYEESVDYASAKGALVSLTRQLAGDYSADGVRVNAVAPGIIRPGKTKSEFAGKTAAELGDQGRLVSATDRTLLPYIGDPADVAAAITFLSSDAARFITAQVLPVDGGWSV
ncbi:3-oxoacyl-ACP reductase [Halobellus salinus]|uniref:3-oxoacyl-ACP reductase n=1 Tax=Halobellus salinus TaxID=931585 RepID=A0A830EQD6_9EURY|nr:SDR family oxidoreductase [Halobellus salinus]GGJ00007.1 3-oxoacyl-ACP reductase [Halobellus salinus]SMP02209.1 3-oxoacyl-[acyl-carrier protein] reductase/meso-butanediol dehydrogenase / (S,S)-butanediol dehydrogenase / diacetyl reductase [Halobellus salinus]